MTTRELERIPRALLSIVILTVSARSQCLYPTFTFEGTATNDRLGDSVAGAGDVDGDGVPDLIVGVSMANGPPGRAIIISGSTGLPLHVLTGPYSLPTCCPGFGAVVAGIGDVDGDGKGDVAVGAPTANWGSSNPGGNVHIFSGASGAPLYTISGTGGGGPPAIVYLGRSIAGVGDISGDGLADFLVGASGLAIVCSGATGIVLQTLYGSSITCWPYAGNDGFGNSVAGPGDVNGDGVPDIAVAASWACVSAVGTAGQVRVFSGANWGPLYTLNGSSLDEGFGRSLG